MKLLQASAFLYLSYFMTNKEKCILYECTKYENIEPLTRILEIPCIGYICHKIFYTCNHPRFKFTNKISVFNTIFMYEPERLNQFKYLQELDISGDLQIFNEHISCLVLLTKINVNYNQRITNLNQLIQLLIAEGFATF